MARKDGGPRRGTAVHIIDGSIYQLIGDGKWAKTRIIIIKWLQRVASEESMNYKELQSDRGLLNHVFDKYISCSPFMKGMHLTLDSWNPHWDPEGWKQDQYGLDIDL